MNLFSKGKFHKRFCTLTAALMAAAVLVGEISYVPAYADKISELEEKIKQAKEEKTKTQNAIEANKKEISSLNQITSF